MFSTAISNTTKENTTDSNTPALFLVVNLQKKVFLAIKTIDKAARALATRGDNE